MRWWRRRPAPTEAERSLTELQSTEPVDPMAGFARIPGLEHLATATDMAFGLKVAGVTSDEDGRTVLTAPHSEGTTGPGDLVGLVLLAAPDNEPGALDDPGRAPEVAAQIRAALPQVRTVAATVVSFEPATPDSPAILVLSGVVTSSIPIGTLVMR